jgi:hypothetical protein
VTGQQHSPFRRLPTSKCARVTIGQADHTGMTKKHRNRNKAAEPITM